MFEHQIDDLKSLSLLRTLRTVESISGTRAVINGRELTLFCTNDYLGLSGHPAVKKAAREAVDALGFGAGSAPLIAGRTAYQERLERELATLKGAQAALVFGSGYLANAGIIPALAREGDLVMSDSLNHASIIDGCRLSRAEIRVYEHCKPSSIKSLLSDAAGFCRVWIVTEGVFGMDGDIAPMPEILGLAKEFGAGVILDDAHATGAIGRSGRGTLEHFGLPPDGVVQMGTLGKALGSYGAFVAADKDIIDWLANSARSFMFSTALPPAACAAARASLQVLKEEPGRPRLLKKNADKLRGLLLGLGLRIAGNGTPIIPVIIGNAEDSLRISEGLMEAAFFAPAVRPPTVPEGGSRIRLTVSALHTEEDLGALAEALKGLVES